MRFFLSSYATALYAFPLLFSYFYSYHHPFFIMGIKGLHHLLKKRDVPFPFHTSYLDQVSVVYVDVYGAHFDLVKSILSKTESSIDEAASAVIRQIENIYRELGILEKVKCLFIFTSRLLYAFLSNFLCILLCSQSFSINKFI